MKKNLFVSFLIVSLFAFSSCDSKAYRAAKSDLSAFEKAVKNAQTPSDLGEAYSLYPGRGDYDLMKDNEKYTIEERASDAEELYDSKFEEFCVGTYLFDDNGNSFEITTNPDRTASIKMNGEVVSTQGSWRTGASSFLGIQISSLDDVMLVEFPEETYQEWHEYSGSEFFPGEGYYIESYRSYNIGVNILNNTMSYGHIDTYTVYKGHYGGEMRTWPCTRR